jgi:hypothetical protein
VSAQDAILACLQELDASAFPLTLPVDSKGQPERLPAVVFKQIGGGGVYSHDKGPAGFEPLWEVRCWAAKYADAKRLAREVTDALDGIGMEVSSEVDDTELSTGTPNVVITASGFFGDEEA